MKKFIKALSIMLAVFMLTGAVELSAAETEALPSRGEIITAVITKTVGNVDADSFAESEDASYKLTEKRLNAMKRAGELSGGGEYINAVIPYAFNYGDGNTLLTDNERVGSDLAYLINQTAPRTQILLMKTLNAYGIVTDKAVTDAYSDAVKLGADIILLDTAVFAGKTDGSDIPAGLYELIRDAYSKGIYTVAPAGDYSVNGGNNAWSELTGSSYALASLPDVKSACAPSTLDEVIAVASRENMYYESITLTTGDGVKIGYSDTTARYEIAGNEGFTGVFDGMTLEYVQVDGQGSAEDCASVELEGKLALIKRGGLTFVEKLENAYNAGAVGAVIYDNIKNNPDAVLMSLEGAKLPAVFISAEDGALLIEAENKTLVITKGETGYIENKRGGEISEFSSRGGMELNSPEFSAVGGLVNVMPDENGGDRVASGTVYAAANFTASLALIIDQCRAKNLNLTPDELLTAMKNASLPIAYNGTDAVRTEYSPRAQGWGSVELKAPFELTSTLIHEGKPYISLGSLKRANCILKFTLTNITDTAHTYKVSASVTGESCTGFTEDESGYLRDIRQTGGSQSDSDTPMLMTAVPRAFINATIMTGENTRDTGNCNLHSEAFKPLSYTLEAGESRKISLSVRLDDATAKEYSTAFENGYFIEGYIYAEDEESGKASIPYSGFVGKLAQTPVFDEDFYSDSSAYEQTYCYTYEYNNQSRDSLMLGENVFVQGKQADRALIAFSPDNDGHGDELLFGFTLNRDVKSAHFEIYRGDGEFLYKLPIDGGLKRSYSNSDGIKQYKAMVWDGRADDNSAYVYPDGEYYFILFCTPSDGGRVQTLKMPFIIDTAAPVVEAYEISERDGKTILTVEVSDDNYVQAVRLYNAATTAEAQSIDTLAVPETTAHTVTVEFDITENQGQLYLEISDYAYNISLTRVEAGE